MRILQHVCAPDDRNGNPRRLWVISSERPCPLVIYEEGYRGRLPECDCRNNPDLVEIYEVHVPVWEYNAIKKKARKCGIYNEG